ncbi:phosphoribosylglycinamide formyltransferase [candidate division WOR-3 bacterium]|nr:phosphoribosylglycinamide formyltransferase [candidate division WOR-3 bacterium]
MRLRISVLFSGRGSNMLAIKNACDSCSIDGMILCAISNRIEAKGIISAQEKGLPVFVFSKEKFPRRRYTRISRLLLDLGVNIVILAGYDELVKKPLLSDFKGRILNIHPAPLPRFGGKGMYRMEVHKKVLESGVKFSGPTIHVVDENYDSGKIIAHEKVTVVDGDTPESLAERILAVEHNLYPKTLAKISRGEIQLF